MNGADPLAQLRAIHLPADISGWPPAIGWWLLALLVLLLAAALWWCRRRYRARAYRRAAQRELLRCYRVLQQGGAHSLYLQNLNAILKRVALVSFPRREVARLHGAAWCRFLQRQAGGLYFADSGLDSAYRESVTLADSEPLQRSCERWVRRHRSRTC